MAQNNLGSFYNEKITVKLKENADISYFEENGYCDYRCGCDLCGSGDAIGIKTNFLKLCSRVERGEWFELNDLDIEVKDTWYDEESENYYKKLIVHPYNETTDREMIEKIYKLYLNFDQDDMIFQHKYEPLTGDKSCVGITSCYSNDLQETIERDDVKNIKNVHVCGLCYRWLITIEGDQIRGKFKESVNPFKYFWSSVIDDFLNDIIEFKNHKVCNKNNEIPTEIDNIFYTGIGCKISGKHTVNEFLQIMVKYQHKFKPPPKNSEDFMLDDWVNYAGAEIEYKK
jgi:hypothetical protein